MGWIKDLLFKKKPKNTQYADILNNYTPIYSQYGTDVYASDVVQQAIACITLEIKKLNPKHVVQNGNDVTVKYNSDLQKVLENPNPIMTSSDFLEKVTWLLFLNYNAFIIPCYYSWKDKDGNEKRKYTALYPINPSQVDFIEDETETLYIKFTFPNNYETTLKYDDVIHLRYRYSVSEYMGGNEFGQPDNDALLDTLKLNDLLQKNLAIAMKSSCAINGVVKYKSIMDNGKTEKALKELEQRLANSESGFLPLDLSAEFTPITHDVKLVDADTLAFLDKKILRWFGVPLCILEGDYTKEQYEAFYQKTLEPIIISFSQAFTKSVFTDREKAFGNKIKLYPKELIFLSTSQTLELIRYLGDRGAIYENEAREAFGLPPIPELEGVRMQSLNYVDTDIAKQYQMGNATGNVQNNNNTNGGTEDDNT